MPVLYGVFLYMGVSSLKGIQVNHHRDKLLFLKNLFKKSLSFDVIADAHILLSSSTV